MYCGLDTETTGLPGVSTDAAKNRWKPIPDFKELSLYDNARLVQVCFMFVDIRGIQETYTRIINVGVLIPNSEFHGITYDMVVQQGITLIEFFNDLQEILNKTTVLFAYNIQFDLNIIKSELFRFSVNNPTQKQFADNMIASIDSKMHLCAMLFAANEMRLNRMPSLKQFYFHVFGKEFDNAHTADADIRATYDAMIKCGFPFT